MSSFVGALFLHWRPFDIERELIAFPTLKFVAAYITFGFFNQLSDTMASALWHAYKSGKNRISGNNHTLAGSSSSIGIAVTIPLCLRTVNGYSYEGCYLQ